MKKSYLAIFFFLTSLTLEAQLVALVDYMKVPENGAEGYLEIEKQWKALHQSRVESGKIVSWRLWYVRNSGSNSTYNYVTVTTYENFAKTGTPLTEEELKQAFGTKMDEVLNKTVASRSLVGSETVHLEASIASDVPDKYLLVNFIKTDNLDEYLNMEKTAYQPFHEESKRAGERNSWRLWTRWPYQDDAFQAVVVDGYLKFEDINSIDLSAYFGKVTAGKSPGDVMNIVDLALRTEKIRTIAKAEIWDLVDSTAPKSK